MDTLRSTVPTRWFLPALWTAFFLSGAAGLVYEVVWARYLTLVVGGTAWAHVLVLAAYMGGLALGSWTFGRIVDRVRDPVVLYTYLEMAIGLWGLAFPLLFRLGSGLYIGLTSMVGADGVGGTLAKLVVAGLLLGPSTFLMGGTLPLLVRGAVALPERVGRGVAGLYFINSLGAVTGALATGFFLVPALGLAATLTVAALINEVVAVGLLGAWRFGALVRPATGPEGEAPRTGPVPTPDLLLSEFPGIGPERTLQLARLAVLGAGFSGFIVMIYEVAWIRLLSTILGSSTYSFTLMLAAFITGIALGSLLARRLARGGRPFFWFALAQTAIGVALLVTLPLYARLPYLFLDLQQMVARTPGGYNLHELLKYLFCLLLMMPPTIASGAALPLATDVAARLQQRVGWPVGQVYAVNTAGTILGALLGGLVMLPLLGVRLTMECGILVNLAVGIGLLALHPAVGGLRLRRIGVAMALLFLLYLVAAPAWDRRALASGVFRWHQSEEVTPERFREELERIDVAFYTEDVNGTVAVLRTGQEVSLVVNGKADASTFRNDQITQTLIAAIPAAMVPDARRALVVGLGSGQTAGHLLHYPVERVEVVEISPGVVAASRFFDHINGRPLDDPRTELATQDAKTFLLTRPDARYDLILSEPSNPWIAGIGGLFSLEYFRTLRDRLEPGGAVAQWIHAYEQDDETLACVLLTFGEVFPFVTVWSMSNADLLLVGTRQPPVWDFPRAAEALEREAVAGDLARIGLRGLFTLLSRQLMSPLRVGEANSLGGWINTDDHPFLEYRAPRAFFLDRQATLHVRFDERNRTLRNTRLALKDYLDGRVPTVRELTDLDEYLEGSGESLPRLHASVAAAWSTSAPADAHAADRALRFGVVAQRAAVEEAARLWRRTPDDSLRTVTYIDLLTEAYATLRSAFYDASDLAGQLLEVLPAAADRLVSNRGYYHYLHGQVAYDQGRYDLALASLDQTRQLLGLAADPTALRQILSRLSPEQGKSLVPVTDPRTPPGNVLVYLARTQFEVGLIDQARETFRSAYRVDPRNTVAAFWLVELDNQLGSGRFRPGPGPPPVP